MRKKRRNGTSSTKRPASTLSCSWQTYSTEHLPPLRQYRGGIVPPVVLPSPLCLPCERRNHLMATLNQCSFIGRLGKDPDMSYTPTGKALTKFSIAIDQGKDQK